ARFTTVMRAAYTTMPMARIMANRVMRLIVKPRAAMAMKAPIMVTGTVVAGTSVPRKFWRNTRITMSTRKPAMKRVQYTPEMASRTNREVSYRMAYLMPAGNCWLISAMALYTRSATAMTLPRDSVQHKTGVGSS